VEEEVVARLVAYVASVLLGLTWSRSAVALDLIDPQPAAEWIVTINGKVTASPSYPGAKTLSVLPYPTLALRDAGTPATFSAPDDNISLALFDNGWLKAGPALKFIGARTARDDRELLGLAKVPWSLEAGAFVEFYPHKQLRTRIEIREGFHGYSGLYADLGADWIQPWKQWQFSFGPRLALAGGGFMNTYFSVSPMEAAANGMVMPFKASGGLVSVGLAGAATYRWSPSFALTGWLRYDRLQGDAAASPIASKLGSRNQFSLGLIGSYSFTTAKLF
jgi:MipA family protein